MVLETGVYKIVNRLNGDYYLGSTKTSFEKRMSFHSEKLKRNKHHSIHLQRAWNKYGEDNFELEVLHRVPAEYARKLEQHYLNVTPCHYNCTRNANGFEGQFSKKECETMLVLFTSGQLSCSEIAKKYGVSSSLIRGILRGEKYERFKLDKQKIETAKQILDKNRHKPVLSAIQVGQIKWLTNRKEKFNLSNAGIGEYFKVSERTISSIHREEKYKEKAEIDATDILDLIRKNRHTGPRPNAKRNLGKLSKEECISIMNDFLKHALSPKKIAEKYGVSNALVYLILKGKIYKHHDLDKSEIQKAKNKIRS